MMWVFRRGHDKPTGFLRNTKDGLVNEIDGDDGWPERDQPERTLEGSIGNLGKSQGYVVFKRPPKALKKNLIRGLRGTFLVTV
jgi:hypothetical protein